MSEKPSSSTGPPAKGPVDALGQPIANTEEDPPFEPNPGKRYSPEFQQRATEQIKKLQQMQKGLHGTPKT